MTVDSYERYEKDCKRIRELNVSLLKDFESWLAKKSLSAKTIKKHYSNVDFYINNFLLYEEAIEAVDGAGNIGGFLGYWFIGVSY